MTTLRPTGYDKASVRALALRVVVLAEMAAIFDHAGSRAAAAEAQRVQAEWERFFLHVTKRKRQTFGQSACLPSSQTPEGVAHGLA